MLFGSQRLVECAGPKTFHLQKPLLFGVFLYPCWNLLYNISFYLARSKLRAERNGSFLRFLCGFFY